MIVRVGVPSEATRAVMYEMAALQPDELREVGRIIDEDETVPADEERLLALIGTVDVEVVRVAYRHLTTKRAPRKRREPKPGSVAEKAIYVRRQGQTRDHHCHWPGCPRQVPPAMWGCKEHWFRLPKALRDRIWATYIPGQEISGTPSGAYVEAAAAVQEWIATQ